MNLLVNGQKGRKISLVTGIKTGAVLFPYCLLCTMSNSSTKFIDFLGEVNSQRSPIFWLEISISPMKKHGFNQARRLGCEDRVWETLVTLAAGITFILQVECKMLPHFTFYPIHITFWGAPKMVLRKQKIHSKTGPCIHNRDTGVFPWGSQGSALVFRPWCPMLLSRGTQLSVPALKLDTHSSPGLLEGSPHTWSLGHSWPHWPSDPLLTIPYLTGSRRLTYAGCFQSPVITSFQWTYLSMKQFEVRRKVEVRLQVLLLLSLCFLGKHLQHLQHLGYGQAASWAHTLIVSASQSRWRDHVS